MLNLFQLASNDQSVYYLGQIFGNMGIALVGTGPVLLASMFKVFNSALLVIGTLIVAYVTVMGALFTASEGEFMGKKWGNIWVPLRTLAGIAALFPTASGYCASQIIIMWIIIQGVGAADTVWGTALDYLQVSSTQSVATTVNNGFTVDAAGAVTTLVQTIFQNSVCQAAIVKIVNNKADSLVQTVLPGDGNYTFNFGNPSSANTANECGSITVNGASNIANDTTGQLLQASQDAQKNAMQTIIPVVDVLANYYVNQIINEPMCWQAGTGWTTDASGNKIATTATPGVACNPKEQDNTANDYCNYFGKYSSFSATSCPEIVTTNATTWASNIISQGGSNFINDAATLFYGYAQNYTAQSKLTQVQKNPASSNVTSDKAIGWVMAGAYYYKIASNQNSTTDYFSNFIDAGQYPTMPIAFGTTTPPNGPSDNSAGNQLFATSAAGGQSTGGTGPTGAYGIASIMIGQAQEASGETGSIGITNGGTGRLPLGGVGAVAVSVANSFISAITPGSNQDPIVKMHTLGHQYLIDADIIFITFTILGIGLGIASTYVIVMGNNLNPVVGTSQFFQSFIIPLIFFFIGYLISIGGLLGVYLPLVPYTIFTMGVIGWFIGVIEAMCAAPLVALGMLSPSGQHEILGKSEPAIGILMNLFMRPTLMVFGMMAAMLLGIVIVNFINATFFAVISQFGSLGIVEAFMYVTVYTTLVISALNKCYALIYMLPETVVTWISGTAKQYGEAEAAGQMKDAVGAAGGKAESAGRSGMGSVSSAGDAAKTRGKQNAQAKKMKGAEARGKASEAHKAAMLDALKKRE